MIILSNSSLTSLVTFNPLSISLRLIFETLDSFTSPSLGCKIPIGVLILDLSIPKNVHDNVKELPNVMLVHLDDLSKITDETHEKRKEHIPFAENIIEEVKKTSLLKKT